MNGLFQSTDAQSALQHFSDSPVLTHIYTLMAEAAMKGANCSSGAFGVQYLAQGHFDLQLGGARILTINLHITRWLTLPPTSSRFTPLDRLDLHSSTVKWIYYVDRFWPLSALILSRISFLSTRSAFSAISSCTICNFSCCSLICHFCCWDTSKALKHTNTT